MKGLDKHNAVRHIPEAESFTLADNTKWRAFENEYLNIKEGNPMRTVKKYANRKLYDTVDKNYITMDKLAQLIKDGEEVTVIDNKTGEDITGVVVSQLLAREKREDAGEVPSGILIQLLRKGGGTIRGYAKKYAALWQGTFTMAEDEIDKLVNLLVRDKEISESEGTTLKKEILNHSENLKKWVSQNVERRVNDTLSRMNLASRGQVRNLTESIERLTRKVEELEKARSRPAAAPEVKPGINQGGEEEKVS